MSNPLSGIVIQEQPLVFKPQLNNPLSSQAIELITINENGLVTMSDFTGSGSVTYHPSFDGKLISEGHKIIDYKTGKLLEFRNGNWYSVFEPEVKIKYKNRFELIGANRE